MFTIIKLQLNEIKKQSFYSSKRHENLILTLILIVSDKSLYVLKSNNDIKSVRCNYYCIKIMFNK